MRVTVKIVLDESAGVCGCEAITDNGHKLTRFESAHILTRIAASLIKDGIAESGGRLVVPVQGGIPTIRA